jgi:hypothetical protein
MEEFMENVKPGKQYLMRFDSDFTGFKDLREFRVFRAEILKPVVCGKSTDFSEEQVASIYMVEK